MRFVAILPFFILAGFGCHKSVEQPTDAVTVSKNNLAACLQEAENSYALVQANLIATNGRLSAHDYEVEDFESRRAYDASRALCEQRHTNSLLEELLNRHRKVR
jgi:hypothetical protein